METKKGGTIILVIPKNCMKIFWTVTELWSVQEYLEKIIKGA